MKERFFKEIEITKDNIDDIYAMAQTIKGIRTEVRIHGQCFRCGKPFAKSVTSIVRQKRLCKEQLGLCRGCSSKWLKLQKYGDENYHNTEAMEKTKKERYGNPHWTNPEKVKKTMQERYGGYTLQSEVLSKKVLDTKRKIYGSNLEGIVESIKATKEERYGNSSYNNSQKQQITMLQKYGVMYALQDESLKLKCQETWLKNHGTLSASELDATRTTMLHRYGVKCIFQSDAFKQKMLEQYGIEHAPRKRIEYNGEWFDSNWEVIFYRYWRSIPGAVIKREPCSFKYVYDGKEHEYVPDFWLRKPDGTESYYEVKGDHFFAMKEGKEVMVNPYDHSQDAWSEAKHQCALQHGVIFVRQKDIEELEKLLS